MKISTCVYLIQNHKWLMLLRNKKENDINQNKYIGVGGKLEPNETIEQCAIREVNEETHLNVNELCFCGIVDFINENSEDEKIYVYTSHNFDGQLYPTSEGTLYWIDEDEVLNLNLWEGDKIFLSRMIHSQVPFYLSLFYDKDGNLKHMKEENIL